MNLKGQRTKLFPQEDILVEQYYLDYGDTRMSYRKLSGDALELSTVQLTHICSKGCRWRDVDFVYRNSVYQQYSRRSGDTTHSSADEVTAGHRGTCGNRSVVAASAGSRTRVQQALDASYHQP